jgi:hypothetical protein
MNAIKSMSLAVLLGLLTLPVAAQHYRANVRGTVWTPNGSPASAVAIAFTSESTGETRQVVSGPDGAYTVAGLLPGVYRVEAKDSRYPQFVARVSASIAHDVSLDLRFGLVPISVDADVRPTFVALDRYSPAATTRIEGSFLTRLPFDGRNFLATTLIAPGISQGRTGIAANGTDDLFTAYVVDGIYDVDPRLGLPAVRPQLDSIDEMEVRGWPFGAAFGRTAGAQVNVVTKSGTNDLHGGAVGFFRSSTDSWQLGGFAGGPLATNRTFAFANYEGTGADDETFDDPSHLLSLRLDQIVSGSRRLSGRYGLDDGILPGRTGHNAGVSFHTPVGPAVNESRAGMTNVSLGDAVGLVELLESTTYQLANDTTVPIGMHLVTAGAEWYGAKSGFRPEGLTATAWGLFVQDDWHVLPRVSVMAGVRFDRAEVGDTNASDSGASPRLGVVWTTDRDAQMLVRAGYGLYRNFAIFEGTAPELDAWTVSVERQLGRARSYEVAYVSTRGDHMPLSDRSRFNALELQFEQRSETGITAIVSYTYGKWVEEYGPDDVSFRSPFDARHRLNVALAAYLPMGKDRRLFSTGMLGTILSDLELTGILVFQTGRPLDDSDVESSAQKTIDAGLVKNIRFGQRRALQLRAETFNLTNRENPLGPGRRYQLGGRVLF